MNDRSLHSCSNLIKPTLPVNHPHKRTTPSPIAMVQLEPNLVTSLDRLGPSGVTFQAEKKWALDHSLPVKKTEAAVSTLSVWGQIATLNGKDYVIAEGFNKPRIVDRQPVLDVRYFYSQDGVKWIDLEAIDEQVTQRAATIKSKLSGDPSQVYTVEEPNPDAQNAGEDEGEEAENSKVIVHEITELQRLRSMVDSISAATSVVPKVSGCRIAKLSNNWTGKRSLVLYAVLQAEPNAFKGCETVTADCKIVPNCTFSGVDYPDKLESYIHRQGGPTGASLAEDTRGTWSLHFDPFKGIAICRSLIWLGYVFYYDHRSLTWDALYSGDGLPNRDLIFML